MIPDHLGGHLGFTSMLIPTFNHIVSKYAIKSVLDVGCGPAGMVEYANYNGIYSIGIDGDFDLPKKDYVLVHDFTTGKIEIDKKFDLIIDDGLHTSASQIVFFQEAFKYLEDDGLFIVEDVFENAFMGFLNQNNYKYQIVNFDNSNSRLVLIYKNIQK